MLLPSRHLLVAASLASAIFCPLAARPRTREDTAVPEEISQEKERPPPRQDHHVIIQMAFVAPDGDLLPEGFDLPATILRHDDSSSVVGECRKPQPQPGRIRIRGPPVTECEFGAGA